MSDELNVSVETQEVAEPATETHESVETQEVAEPVAEETQAGEKTAQDAAFAEMRRKVAEAEKRAQEAEERYSQQSALLSRASDAEDPALALTAQILGLDPDELQAAIDEEMESERLENEREALKQEVDELRFERAKSRDLEAVQKIDPNIKTFEELGEVFLLCRTAGLTSEQAYLASKAVKDGVKVSAPTEIGKVNQTEVEKDFFTREEVERMFPAEIDKNLENIEKSMKKW